jgi:predicted dehydrogenase
MPDVRWGILGTGAMAGLFAEGLAFVPGSRLVAVGSRSRAAAESFAARFGPLRAHAGYEGLVRDADLDVIYVASRNEFHEEHCLLAIEAGKPVLCEKPFALDATSGARVVEAARRRGVFCMEAMWMRFSPVVREALALARSGRLGEVRMVSAELGFPHVAEAGSRLFAPPGGGALLDLGVYPLSLAQALLGRPRRIESHAVIGPTGVDEQFTAILDYGEGCQATVAASLRSQLNNAATIHGTEGVLRIEAPLYFPHRYGFIATPRHGGARQGSRGLRARIRLHPLARGLSEVRARMRQRDVVRHAPGNGYGEQAAEVVRCLRSSLRESPEMSLDATLEVLASMDAVRARWAAST